MDLKKEINRRRTFAIISHPDAGKTTLTEKFLLYGGAIREAGSVKSRRANKHAVSDWMEIEKQRGISVTSSVLQFEYDDFHINILDTPGHQDFSEDTYRTLMAADVAVMVIDCAKGVEAQTKKLFHVCKMRGIPIFTFVNKMDRRGLDPFDLVDDIENVLDIKSYPITWPIGNGKDFKGVYNRLEKAVYLFDDANHGADLANVVKANIDDEVLSEYIGESLHEKLQEDIELLDMAGDSFDESEILNGNLTPIFFGSALTNFGVEPFLKSFLSFTPPPLARKSNKGLIEPTNDDFTGFIFKIQANMNKAHRDRIAFIRICSGKYEKGMSVNHVNKGKSIRLAQSTQFMADERVLVEEAYAGDIIGLHDPGIYNIGDTLSVKDSSLLYDSIPRFSPEHFVKISTLNAMKRKQFVKGLEQLAQEGTIQIFKRPFSGMEELYVGVVGVLQFDVLKYRLNNEYNVEVKMEMQPYKFIRWVADGYKLDDINLTMDTIKGVDEEDRPVLLFQNEWSIRMIQERNEGLELMETSSKF